jgi:hypothetical protein
MAQTDLELLTVCANFTLHHNAETEQKVIEELQTSGATRLVMSLRMLRLQRAVLAIGMFSLFEALLQSKLGWLKPFEELDKYLRNNAEPNLASAISDYKLAINVLKHGEGPSLTKLLARAAALDFRIQPSTDPFFDEGDVSEVDVLVDADEKFVRRCAELIEAACAVIRSKEQVRL